jgi:S-adenosylmethionine hydrolase
VAVEVGDGASVLVGPDNGVLAPAVAMVGGATRAVWLNDPEYHLDAPGSLFDGRDVFAPVASHLCNGVALDELGELVEPAGLFPGIFPISEPEDGGIRAEVLWIDRYGNAQLNVDPSELDELGSVFEIRMGERVRSARRAHHFSELGTGSIGLVVDSYGFMALVCDRASAATELTLGTGDSVILVPLGDDDRPAPPSTPVQLGVGPRRATSTGQEPSA